MKTEELLKLCKLYNGEDKNPFSDFFDSWFWDMERVWVSHGGIFDGECSTYIAHNFKDFDMPYTLQMVMFTSWAKNSWNLDDEISDFYSIIEKYLSH